MGYESFSRLPYISSYGEAKLRLERTVPIRRKPANSDDPTRYPLGDRRYARKFSIRMADDDASMPTSNWYSRCPNSMPGDIELLVYQSPVVTFHTDNTVTLFHGKTKGGDRSFDWDTSTAKFIDEVLGHYLHSVVTDRRRLVLTLRNGEKIVAERKTAIRLTLNEATRTMARATQTLPTVLRMDRTKANAVRKRYGEFYRYLKGMIALRREPHTTRFHNYQSGEDVYDTQYLIRVTEQEMRNVVDVVVKINPRGGGLANHYEEFKFIYPPHKKPAKCVVRAKWDTKKQEWGQERDTESYLLWEESAANFIELIKPLAEGEDFDRHYRAFVMLVYFQRMPGNPQDCEVEADGLPKLADQILFTYHSDEVLYRAEATPGSVPSLKYEKWVTRDVDDER